MFPVVFSFGFAVLLDVTLLILKICNAGCLHLGVCWLGRMGAALFMVRKTRQQVIGTKQTREQPLTRAKKSKTVPVCLVMPHDTSFHFKHQTLHPPLQRASQRTKIRSLRIGGPKGACLYILPKCCYKNVTADLLEKKEVHMYHEKHFSRRTSAPLFPHLEENTETKHCISDEKRSRILDVGSSNEFILQYK